MEIHVGIDIGTTSTKICARRGEEVVYERKCTYPDGRNEDLGVQDTKDVLKTALDILENCKSFLKSENLEIDNIWVCGQMHGIVFWNQKSLVFQRIDSFICSTLFNWTYSTPRTSDFIKSLPEWPAGHVHPGFGIVTFAELFAENPEFLKPFTHCGTIMDLFLTFVTQSSKVLISHHNAHSWGYCSNDTWQSDIIEILPDWIHLPEIEEISETVGRWHGAKCHVASGDLQASVASLGQGLEENTAYIILGTSAQLCCLVDQMQIPTTVPPTVVQLPYSKDRKLLAACSMNGGNALEAVLKMHSPESYSSEKLANLLGQLDDNVQVVEHLRIDPIFIPERGTSKKRFISGLSPETSDLEILEATHIGIIRNLFSMFPESLLRDLRIQKLALIGSAQCSRFKRHIQKDIELELALPSSVISTPLGATRF